MVTFSHKKDKLSFDFKENLGDLEKLGLGEKEPGAPPGTIPIGDSGWYMTPLDDAADPMDCIRYPNSPWCKVGLPDLKVPFAIDFSPKVHQCGFDIEVDGILFWLPTPTGKLAYRYPGECRNEPPPPSPPPPPRTPGHDIITFPGCDDSTEGYFFVAVDYSVWGTWINDEECVRGGFPQFVPSINNYSRKWLTANCPKTNFYPKLTGTFTEKIDGVDSLLVRGCATPVSAIAASDFGEATHYYQEGLNTYYFGIDNQGRIGWKSFESSSRTIVDPSIIVAAIVQYRSTASPGFLIYKGQWGYIRKFMQTNQRFNEDEYFRTHVDFFFDLSCKPSFPYASNPPPPNPLSPPPDCDCMSCCPDYSSLIKQLLNEIKKINTKLGEYPFNATIFDEDETRQEAQAKTLQIGNISSGIRTVIDRNEKIAKIIGIDALPLEVPKSIADPINSNIIGAVWDWLTGADKKRINNLFEYHVWMLEQFSVILGRWQLGIAIEDTDQLKEGEQGIPTGDGEKKDNIALPDVASTLKESMMLQIQQYKIQGLILDVALKTLTETASTHQTAARCIAQIEEIVEFLDYPTNDASMEVPVQITIPGKDISQKDQNDLGKYLKPSKTKIRYDKWTKDQSLSDLLTHLATLIGSRGGAG